MIGYSTLSLKKLRDICALDLPRHHNSSSALDSE